MSDVSQVKLSRRKLMAVALVMPMAAPAARSAFPAAGVQAVAPDPLIAKAAEWFAANARLDALSVETDDLQGAVFDKARAQGIRGDKVCCSRMPEARAWRAKKQEYEEASQLLATLTGGIRKMRAVTVAGAIAKIELSLHVQCDEWSEHAFELAEEGIAELRQLALHPLEQR